ncbi:hypothetical protein [Cellulophaga sp. BC115SP]|uniref:hypothetical protein n=1 Tax=Cellulophaga sp. BC115SP TaxID=2683263 RepID=UPI001411C76D|nr:hypothetical protein [Cellulophaga sp. BC115SP]NBB28758.1 hypothetical protein [Cellulophaga sp. BC115SP]
MHLKETQKHIKKRLSIGLRRFVKGESIDLSNYQNNEILRYIILSRTDFREYLQNQFIEGMSWDNYCIDWEIDHIVPTSMFNMLDKAELSMCWHFLNLMPMLSKDNEIKANSTYFAKIELEKRRKYLPTNPIIQSLYDKIISEDDIHSKYQYDLDFLKFYSKINYI